MAATLIPVMPASAAPVCASCPTRKSAEWAILSDRDMDGIFAAKTARSYRKGEFVYTQGLPCTGLYCVAAGTLAVGRTEPRLPTVLLRLAHAGETLGYRNLVHGGICANSAKALEPSVICHVDGRAVQRLVQRHKELDVRFRSHIVADLERAEAALAQLAWLPVRSRLARLIVQLAERNASGNGSKNVELTLPMTRRDMADLLCTRPETLTRTMQAMETDGLLHSAGHRVAIPDLQRLRGEIHAAPI